MATSFVYPIDLNLLEILNARFQQLGTDPGSPVEGQFWYNTASHQFKYYDGTTTHILSAAYLLARANHTGTQAASTISDLATVVQAYRLDQFAAPTSDLSLNSHKITNLATPTSANDAASKSYVDGLVNGLQWKESVRAATTANITLSGAQTIDGVSIVAGDRVLVKAQTTGSENGLWVAAAGAWARSADADTSAEVTSGLAVIVDEGTANDNTAWVLSTANPITLGTTALSFVQLSGSGTSYTASTGLQLIGTAFSRDPAYVDTIAQGGMGQTTAAAALAALGGVAKYATAIGDGTSVDITVTHNLGSRDVTVAVYKAASPYNEVGVSVEHATTNTVVLHFAVAPASSAYRCVVTG